MSEVLLIRADASPTIGTGHVMRSIALAEAWQDAGGVAQLASAELSPGLAARIAGSGVQSHDLRGAQASEPGALATLAARLGARWVALDGYGFDAQWPSALHVRGLRVLVLDDFGTHGRHDADLILNQNLAPQIAWYAEGRTGRRLLLGPRYALLRREFRRAAPRPPSVGSALRVLVTLGGADPDNVTELVLRALAHVPLALQIRVVIGAQNPHLPKLSAAIAGLGAELVQSANDMTVHMQWADLAIAGAGSTTWELACLGVPAVLLVLADNQLALASAVHRAGFAYSAGWASQLTAERLSSIVAELGGDAARRTSMAQLGAKIVDGRGALRVCQLMLAELGVSPPAEQSAELTLRPAEPADVHALFAWANDAVTRSSSFSAAAIPFEQHVAWFSRTLDDSTSTLLIGELPGEGAIGQVRLSRRASGDAVISVGLAPEARGRGFGGRLLEAAATRYCTAHPDCERIAAYVKPSNVASIAAFRRAGFTAPVADRFDQHECVRLDYRCALPASATKVSP